ncbi:hypothetical protein [Sulfitobacter sp. JB4-11]|uniref:hypothetical protein n=1 Tax=Sulfitobacter rhodophyticola TaxID=3238304 RepID=UPI003513FB19
MIGMHVAKLGKVITVALATLGTCAWAATKPLDPLVLPEDLANLRIDDLIVKDPLGFDCIQDQHIDLAFHATGKGVRMPRTCLPEPCVKALTPFQLAALIGRNPNEQEWDQYFARYADFCRKEVVAFDAEGADTPVDVLPEAAFWLPLLAQLGTSGGGSGGSAVSTPILGGGAAKGGGGATLFGGGGSGSSGTSSGGSQTSPATEVLSEEVGVQPVPLPAPIWLMLATLCALGGLSRYRRTA